MAAAMNGIALHKGLIPYSGTFLVFTDYCRPSIRLSALMGQRVIYVMTHDSIGLGEDGPTHQPVEHLASLRADARPSGLRRRRCRDARMLAACARSEGHALVLALTRQNLPAVRSENSGEESCAARRHMNCRSAIFGHRLGVSPWLATGSEIDR